MAFLHSLLGRLSSPGWVPNLAAGHTHLSQHYQHTVIHYVTTCFQVLHVHSVYQGDMKLDLKSGDIFTVSYTTADIFLCRYRLIIYLKSHLPRLASPPVMPSASNEPTGVK